MELKDVSNIGNLQNLVSEMTGLLERYEKRSQTYTILQSLVLREILVRDKDLYRSVCCQLDMLKASDNEQLDMEAVQAFVTVIKSDSNF